jgi:hypothetical protein
MRLLATGESDEEALAEERENVAEEGGVRTERRRSHQKTNLSFT